METNGVYFGAEIVRDLTPAPGSRMEKRRQGERGWGGGGQGEGAFISGSHSPAFSHLHLSLSLSVHLSLPPSSSGCQSRSPPPLHVYLFFSGQGYRIPLFWDQGGLLVGSGSRESWGNWDCDFQRPGRGGGRCWRGANPWAESELNQPLLLLLPSPGAALALVPAQLWPHRSTHLGSVTSASPGRSPDDQA